MTDRLAKNECLKCGRPNIRIDDIPFCSKCEIEIGQKAKQMLEAKSKSTSGQRKIVFKKVVFGGIDPQEHDWKHIEGINDL